MKPYWEITPEEVGACLDATHFCAADVGYFRGGGFSSEFETRGGMPVTMTRLNMVAGLGPVLQIAEGAPWTCQGGGGAAGGAHGSHLAHDLVRAALTGSGAFRDVYAVMNNWGANHGAISYGHIGGDLLTLASILRIPVAMHNVPAEKMYRPKYWSSFGDPNRSPPTIAHVARSALCTGSRTDGPRAERG